MNPSQPIYVGTHTCPIDSHDRLSLPLPWCSEEAQSWLTFPIDFGLDVRPDWRYLIIKRTDSFLLSAVFKELGLATDQSPTPATAVEAMRAAARARGFDPLVITHIQIAPRTSQLQLTVAQIDLLGLHNRMGLLLGAFASFQLWSTEEFARFERYTSSASFEKAVRRTLRDS